MPALAISAAKSKDEDIAQAASAEPEHKIIDIMAALEVSLAAGKKADLNIIDYAKTGVNYISVGALIHQARSLDMSFKITLSGI